MIENNKKELNEMVIDTEGFSINISNLVVEKKNKDICIDIDIDNNSEDTTYIVKVVHLVINGLGFKKNFSETEVEPFSGHLFTISYHGSLPHSLKFDEINNLGFSLQIINKNEENLNLNKKIVVFLNNDQRFSHIEVENLCSIEEFKDDRFIEKLEEITSEFETIKDHKPKATKKLKTLGELIGSAYKIDPIKSIEMWTYIYELNKDDGEKSIKFYTYSVFNKIREVLTSAEYSNLLMLNKNIYLTMRKYNYINAKPIIEGLSLLKDFNNLIYCLEVEESFTINNKKNILFITNILNVDDKNTFYKLIKQHEMLSKYSKIIKALMIIGDDNISNEQFNECCATCISEEIDSLLLDLLYKYSFIYDTSFLQQFILNYCKENNDFLIPEMFNYEDKQTKEIYDKHYSEIFNFVIELISENEDILYYYFNQEKRKFELIYFVDNSFFEKITTKWLRNKKYHLFEKYFLEYWNHLKLENHSIAENGMGQLLVNIIDAFIYEIELYGKPEKVIGKSSVPVEVLGIKTHFDLTFSIDNTSGKYNNSNDVYKKLFNKDEFKEFLLVLNRISDEIESEQFYVNKFKEVLKELNNYF